MDNDDSNSATNPFTPADDQSTSLPDDHPATDSNMDDHEVYDEGIDGAAEVEEPGTREPGDVDTQDDVAAPA